MRQFIEHLFKKLFCTLETFKAQTSKVILKQYGVRNFHITFLNILDDILFAKNFNSYRKNHTVPNMSSKKNDLLRQTTTNED